MRSFLPLLALTVAPLAAAQDSVAEYEVFFDATWSSTTHPTAYPASAHFSPLIGGTHNDGVVFWEPGGIATTGIEVMAETGGTGPLQGEVGAAILAGTASSVVLGPPVNVSPGTALTTLTVTEDHPLVTLVTMIAPSPDWFIGVHGHSLLENGSWVDSVTIPLVAYDAGTDSGVGFFSGNINTSPKAPIAQITSGPLTGGVPLGTFTFTRTASTLVYGSGINPAGSMTRLGGTPKLGQTLTLGISDPSGTMLTPSDVILAITDQTSPFFPSGFPINNVGLSMPGAQGEFLLGGNIVDQINGLPWNGFTVPVAVPIPNLPGLAGNKFYAQGILVDPSPRIGLTDAIELLIGS